MNFRSRRRKPDPIAFQIAPMIDFLVVLLCYTLSTQIYIQWESDIGVTLPTSKTAAVNQRLPGEIIVNIHADGTMMVNSQKLDETQLRSLLDRLVQLFPGQPVLIRADKTTAYAHVIAVLDLCRQADLWNISFATSQTETPTAPGGGTRPTNGG